jgi:hypothetical protein
VADVLKQQNFSAFDLSKLEASLYDMKVARGKDQYLARFVGWESLKAEQQELALFAIRTEQGEQTRKLVFARSARVDDVSRLKMLFALVFSARKFESEELVPTAEELEMVK